MDMRIVRTRKPTDVQAELAALADGSLAPERAAQLERLVQGSPEQARRLAEQRRVIELLRATEPSAPDSLHGSVAGMLAGSTRVADGRRLALPSGGRLALPRQRWSLLGAAALAIVALLAVTLALRTGSEGAPTVLQASRLALRAATAPSPSESAHNHGLLTSSVDGIAYPYWGKRFGFSTSGARTDSLGGRSIMTVFYTNAGGRRIGYSIVDGSALDVPAGRSVAWSGVSFRVLETADSTIVTWRRDGHTCILTSRGVASGTLLRLASWQRS